MRLRTLIPKLIALTFDDGPSEETLAILDVFREHGAVGTFFVLGREIRGRESALRRMAAEGSEIANHTFNHPRIDALAPEEIEGELRSTSDAIESIVGFRPSLMRPPHGMGCEPSRASGT